MNNEDITIAIPVFERYDFFEDAVYSAINQSVSCNVIVVDNCSSHTLFKEFVEDKKLPNLLYFRNNENVGAIENWNKCIELSQTKWVSILHSDDMLSKEYIEKITEVIATNNNELAIICQDEAGSEPNLIFKESGRIDYDGYIKPISFLFGNLVGFPGNIFNKDMIQNVKFRNLQGASDYAFWYELSSIKPLLKIKNILSFYRQSEDQDSASIDIEEIVINPAYRLRNEKIRFRNKFLKLLSMYELYKLNEHYIKTYKRDLGADYSYSIGDIDSYFKFFDNSWARSIVKPSLRVLIYLTKKILR
ncbi:glycosyltransferase family 2 protein [Pedobacter sp. GSP4]|uniref:glycosyltransferase family 2 protein n=1 Tax=Pedobacter sp. GSP4 TaxID=3453716 RepID=UPI003EEA147D